MTRAAALFTAVVLAPTALSAGPATAQAWAVQRPPACALATRDQVAAALAEASRRFGLPRSWLLSVVRVESAGRACATSHKGATGLMQVMPTTYAELRRRYGLGPDPYAVRDNIIAGAAYLREMVDRFGPVGALAAYNAGPGRYREHLAGRPLPLETRAYVAKLAPSVHAGAVGELPSQAAARRPALVEAPPLDALSIALRSSLFASQNVPPTDDGRTTDPSLKGLTSDADLSLERLPDGIFVPPSRPETQP